MACIGYLQAMLDINNLDRESGAPVKWCAPRQLVLDDLRKTILRGLRAKPISTPARTWRARTEFAVPPAERAEVVAIVESTRADIVV
jgi:hypothetical protein